MITNADMNSQNFTFHAMWKLVEFDSTYVTLSLYHDEDFFQWIFLKVWLKLVGNNFELQSV